MTLNLRVKMGEIDRFIFIRLH